MLELIFDFIGLESLTQLALDNPPLYDICYQRCVETCCFVYAFILAIVSIMIIKVFSAFFGRA